VSLLDIAKLFQELEWRQRFRLQHALNNPDISPFRIDRTPTVFTRNRYGNVQPWDQSRIKLKVPIDGSDYINASPITLKSRSATSSPEAHSTTSLNIDSTSTNINLSESRYIATQGPKDGQFSHFWNMVMQETVGEVGVIVMLTQCWEGNKEKCGQYFPSSMDMPTIDLEPNEGNDQPLNFTGDPFLDSDPISADADSDPAEDPNSDRDTPEHSGAPSRHGSVTLVDFNHDMKSRSEVRKLTLQVGDESKTIWHYLFNGWPDFAKPEGEDRRALLELVKQSTMRAGNPGQNPRFIHCSAGVGRTGTFIALDFLLRELAQGKLEVTPSSSRPTSSGQHTQSSQEGSDTLSMNGSFGMGKESTPEAKEDLIFETVNTLREQRMMMVMNDVQFSFLYEVLREAYVEMYSAKRLKVVGGGAGENIGVAGNMPGFIDVDMGEPSPKIAKTENMLFIGASEVAQEANKEVERKAANAKAVSINSVIVQAANQGDPYSAVDPEVVKQEEDAKQD
jgi:protein-tyrosine phosphatase